MPGFAAILALLFLALVSGFGGGGHGGGHWGGGHSDEGRGGGHSDEGRGGGHWGGGHGGGHSGEGRGGAHWGGGDSGHWGGKGGPPDGPGENKGGGDGPGGNKGGADGPGGNKGGADGPGGNKGGRGHNFNHNRDGDWDKFKNKHKRQFHDQDDDDNRRSFWEERMDHINSHNDHFKDGKHKYKMTMNKFADMAQDELKKFRGFLSPKSLGGPSMLKGGGPDGMKPYTLTNDDPRTQNASIDWRTLGAVTEIKDQEECGCCWSFASAGALEAQNFLKTGKLVDLSEQNLIDCTKENGNNGCNGGTMTYTFQYVMDKGIMSYSSYPYTQQEGTCQYDSSNVAGTCSGFVNIPSGDEEALRRAVSAIGPVAVAIDASQDSFMLYEDGVYDDVKCSNTSLDHGVLVVGYGSDNGDDFWLVKNSWGTDWGLDGYVKIARNNNNQCGIATEASYPLA